MNEPVILGLTPALVTALITAVANVLKAFGVVPITDQQIESINALAIALFAVLAPLGVLWARNRSTPVASPNLPIGTVVNERDPKTPNGVVEAKG